MTARLTKRDAIVLCPPFGITAPIAPVVLTRYGIAVKWIIAAQAAEVVAVDRTPAYHTIRLRFESRHLTRGQIRVAAPGGKEKFHDPFGVRAQGKALRRCSFPNFAH